MSRPSLATAAARVAVVAGDDAEGRAATPSRDGSMIARANSRTLPASTANENSSTSSADHAKFGGRLSQEGGEALARLAALEELQRLARLDGHPLRERAVDGGLGGAADRADGGRGGRGDLARELAARPRAPAPAGAQRSTRPDRVGLLGADRAPGDQQVERLAVADHPRQPLRAAGRRDRAELDLRQPELRAVGRHPQRARERELEPAAERRAVDRRDRRARDSPSSRATPRASRACRPRTRSSRSGSRGRRRRRRRTRRRSPSRSRSRAPRWPRTRRARRRARAAARA